MGKEGYLTCVTPLRSILKRLTLQLPVEMALTNPLVMMSSRMSLSTSYVSLRACRWAGGCQTRSDEEMR